MISRFRRSLNDSLAHRKGSSIPQISPVLITLLVFLIGYIILSLTIAPEGDLDYHFVKEEGSITALSAILLAMASGFAGMCFFLSRPSFNYARYFWLLSSLAFCFFALDELLGFHEFGGSLIKNKIGSPQAFRNWNDVIVIGYGFLAIPVFIAFLPEILRYPKVAEMMAIAFVFYGVHTIVDSTFEPRTNISVVVEESAKLLSSAFFSLCMFIAALGIASSSGSSSKK